MSTLPNSLKRLTGTEHPVSSQQGFTLLELMVAMAIFAILAVAGWQVFDGIIRSKDRAEQHLQVLTEVQYGYAQIQRDMMQAVPYQLPSTAEKGSPLSTNANAQTTDAEAGGPTASNDKTSSESIAEPYFRLEQNQLSFIRRADPDPRYAQSAQLERIVYRFNDEELVRERYTDLSISGNERPLESIMVSGITNGQIQVLLPEPSSLFPSPNQSINAPNNLAKNRKTSLSLTAQSNSVNQQPSATSGLDTEGPDLLPKGVEIKFSVRMGNLDTPINWVFALSKLPPKPTMAYSSSSQQKSKDSNKTDNSQDGTDKKSNSSQSGNGEDRSAGQNSTNTAPKQSIAP